MRSLILLLVITISACTQEEYVKKINECISIVEKDKLGHLTDNPLKSCISKNVIGLPFPDYSLKSIDGDRVSFRTIDKPIFILILSRQREESFTELASLNTIIDGYKDKITFILLAEDESELTQYIVSSLLRQSFRWLKVHPDIIRIPYKEKDIAEEEIGNTIFGIRNIDSPTAYYITKDKRIFNIETLGDIFVQENKVILERNLQADDLIADPISDDSLNSENFRRRVIPNLDKLIVD